MVTGGGAGNSTKPSSGSGKSPGTGPQGGKKAVEVRYGEYLAVGTRKGMLAEPKSRAGGQLLPQSWTTQKAERLPHHINTIYLKSLNGKWCLGAPQTHYHHVRNTFFDVLVGILSVQDPVTRRIAARRTVAPAPRRGAPRTPLNTFKS